MRSAASQTMIFGQKHLLRARYNFGLSLVLTVTFDKWVHFHKTFFSCDVLSYVVSFTDMIKTHEAIYFSWSRTNFWQVL